MRSISNQLFGGGCCALLLFFDGACTKRQAASPMPRVVEAKEWKLALSALKAAVRIEVAMVRESTTAEDGYSRVGPFVIDDPTLIAQAQQSLHELEDVELNRLKSHVMLSPLFAKMTFESQNPLGKTVIYLESDGLVCFPDDEKYMGKLADKVLIDRLYKWAQDHESGRASGNGKGNGQGVRNQ